MDKFDREKHWENIYQTKQINEVSWYQPKPETSLKLIAKFNLSKTAKIIDIGGGDSFLVDYLLDLGYQNITVLDISATAIEKAKKRLGKLADKINWIVSDINDFEPTEKFDLWHDRAAFHFLTKEEEKNNYIKTAYNSLINNGALIIGTFSTNGPTKCSGITIKQYSVKELEDTFAPNFNKIDSLHTQHHTPFNTVQEFVFCRFTSC